MTLQSALTLVASLALTAALSAQAIPEVTLVPSPPGQAAVQLGGKWDKTADGPRYSGGKWVVVNYGRPLLRGRKDIFGSGADYGNFVNAGAPLWRAGANDTTRLITQVPLQIGGKTIAPGTYNVFVDLKPGNWTLVLSTQPVQEKFDPTDTVRLSGATNYDPKFDVLRAPMTVRAGGESVEQFTIGFVNVTETTATLVMSWEKTAATIDLKLGMP